MMSVIRQHPRYAKSSEKIILPFNLVPGADHDRVILISNDTHPAAYEERQRVIIAAHGNLPAACAAKYPDNMSGIYPELNIRTGAAGA